MKAVNNYIVVEKIKQGPKTVGGLILTEDTDVDNTGGCFKRGCRKCCPKKSGDFYCRLAIQTDEWSRKLFPLAFGMFNFFYWSYYTVWSREEEE